MSSNIRIDIIGNKYNNLYVDSFSHQDKENKSLFKCICNCGEIFYLKSHIIIKNKHKCQCMRENKTWSKHLTENILSDWWNNLLKGATKRKLPVTITPEYLELLWKEQDGKCYLTGEPIYLPKRATESFYTASLDRLDNNLGYIKGNVKWCHRTINFMKYTMDLDDFVKLCSDIANNQ